MLSTLPMMLSLARIVCSEDELTRRDGVVQKLRTRLPSKSAAQLAHLDSDSIINLYNHHVPSNRG